MTPTDPMRPGGGFERDPIDLPGVDNPPPAQATGAPPPGAPTPYTQPTPMPVAQEEEDAPPPEPESYGPAPELMETLEATLKAAILPNDVFKALRDREASDFFTSLLNVLAWSLGGMLIFLVLTFMMHPSTSGLGLLPTLITLVGSMIAAVALSFPGAGLLHGLSMLAGGKGDFARSYQILSLLGAAAPISAVLVYLPVPLIWLVPTIYVTYQCTRGVELMHRCYGMPVMSTVGLCGLILTALQFTSHKKIEDFQKELATRATIYSTSSGESSVDHKGNAATMSVPERTAMPTQRPSGTYATPGMEMGRSLTPAVSPGMQPAEPLQESSLGMIKRTESYPSRAQTAPEDGYTIDQNASAAQQSQNMAQTFLNMLNAQLRNNPDMLKKMPPEQRAKVEKLLNKANSFSQQGGTKGLNEADAQKLLQEMGPETRQPAPRHRSNKSQRRTAPRVPVDEDPFSR